MTLKRTKILVVDDDVIVLQVTKERLESAGYEVVARDAPLGTMKAILDFEPDLVLLDVNMPGLSGEGLAELVRRNPNMPRYSVAFHSSASAETLETLTAQVGALGWISKTGDASEFLVGVQSLLRKKARITGKFKPIAARATPPTPLPRAPGGARSILWPSDDDPPREGEGEGDVFGRKPRS